MKRNTIRGVRILREPHKAREPVEHRRYSLDVCDVGGNLVKVLGRVADLAVAHAAFEAAVVKYLRSASASAKRAA